MTTTVKNPRGARIWLWFILLSIATTVSSQSDSVDKVLFVGNSYTYFWNLPQTVQQMATEAQMDYNIRQSTAGGANLGHHWRGERQLATRHLLGVEHWDVIVLQDHSLRTIQAPDSLTYFAGLLQEVGASSARRTILYMTWARQWDPTMIDEIKAGYVRAAEQLGAEVAPVGLAWQRAREVRPDIALFDPDGSHPSALGAYLTSCVFHYVITGQSPEGLPHRLVTRDADGEKLYLTIQSPGDASFCQRIAKAAVQDFVAE